jgi:hypothetical protein
VTHTPLRPARSTEAELESGKVSRREKWPWVVGGVLALVAVGSGAYAIGAAGDRPATRPAATAAASAPSGAEGAFMLTVGKTECGVDSVGPAELPQRAEGQFCLVDVSVTNTGTEAALLDPGAQRAVDGHGREHAVADQAGAFLNDREPSLLDEIRPGATVRGVLAFDVPAGERLSVLVLHESMGSRGVRMPLS